MHILHHKTEFYWIGKRNIDNMVTSLWIADGKGLLTITNLLLPHNFDHNTYNQTMMESEPSTPTTPGFLLNSSAPTDVGKPFSLGYRMDHDIPGVDECARWQTSDFDQLEKNSVYIPLDFYPLCKLTSMQFNLPMLTFILQLYF